MLKDLPYDVVGGVPMTRFDGVGNSKLYLVHRMNEWEAFYELLMKQKRVACDTETTGFRYYAGHKIVGLSFGWGNTHFYIPVRHESSVLGGTVLPQLDMDVIRPDLQAFFAQTDVYTIWHNFKFDQHFYKVDDIIIRTPFHDTRILWQLVDENAPGALKRIASGWKDDMGRWHPGLVHKAANDQEKRIGEWRGQEAKARRDEFKALLMARADLAQAEIKYQGMKRTEVKKQLIEEEFQDNEYRTAKKDDIHYGVVPITMMCEYAGLDTFLTYMLYDHTIGKVANKNNPKLGKLYLNELGLSKALFDAEEEGTLMDVPYLHETKIKWQEEMAELVLDLQKPERLGLINVNSADQLAEAFINKGATLTKTTDSGKWAMDKEVLKGLAKDYDEARDLLRLREITKLKGTYVDGILDKLGNRNILHCSFNQNVATGRMSSTDPNLQNIPAGDTAIRRAFICPDEYIYVFADYSQVEVRLTAHFSGDPLMLEAYEKGQDIHLRTACEMFNIPIKEGIKIYSDDTHPRYKEIKILRGVAKTINFGIIYGVGAPGLAGQITRPEQYANISDRDWVAVCQSYIDAYLYKYRGVKKFIVLSSREVRRFQQIQNHFGRIRHLPHAAACKIYGDKSYKWLEARAQRQGTNFVVQGTAADVFKTAVVRVHKLLQHRRSKAVNFVHDEIQIYLHKSEFDLLYDIKAAMEDFDFSVPLLVDFEFSTTSWADKREMSIEEARKCYL